MLLHEICIHICTRLNPAYTLSLFNSGSRIQNKGHFKVVMVVGCVLNYSTFFYIHDLTLGNRYFAGNASK